MQSFYKASNEHDFFDLLPQDWKDVISPSWHSYSENSSIFLLKDNEQIVAGGVVFSTCPPDMLYDQAEAGKWFDKGYLYIGFLWVPEKFRNHHYGSGWIRSLKNKFPSQKFWLTIEDEGLKGFYIKNGFRSVKALQNGPGTEWLMIYDIED